MKKQMKMLLKWGAIPVVAVLVWTAWSHWGKEKKAAMPAFRTGVVTVGDLQKTISASGTVEPEELVDVGAVNFLKENNVEEDKIREIICIISHISFSAQLPPPESIEGKCVQDADRLDALGAIGIARTFAFGGSRGRRLHDPLGVDSNASVQHFYDKLLRLKDTMHTPTGRRLAEERDQYMRAFLQQFYAEWDGLR